jgi:HlyD family secretion protein
MNNETLKKLTIPAEHKQVRKKGPVAIIGLVAVLMIVGLAIFLRTRGTPNTVPGAAPAVAAVVETNAPPAPAQPGDVVLTVSGYVIPRERIEISPRFQGTVKWIGVKKGDQVKKDEVLVRLEDDEYRARVQEAEGRVAVAEANLENAKASFARAKDLREKKTTSEQDLDDAQRGLRAAEAELTMARAQLDLNRTWLDWCTIRAPITGTVLEKLVNPNELVVPQSFGGSKGPSTAFLAMADLNDLQVEIDLNEADTPKVSLGQACRVSPEAYPDKTYQGRVAEIAPEANRSKGTLQIKVQVENPDRFLTPELTAKVEFLAP